MNDQQIFLKVREVMGVVFGVDDDEITPEATLMGDLRAEPIDFLDMFFRLGRTFEVEISRQEIDPNNILTNPEYLVDSQGCAAVSSRDLYPPDTQLSAAGLQELQQRMSWIDWTNFALDPRLTEFNSYLTVDSLCRYISLRLHEPATA